MDEEEEGRRRLSRTVRRSGEFEPSSYDSVPTPRIEVIINSFEDGDIQSAGHGCIPVEPQWSHPVAHQSQAFCSYADALLLIPPESPAEDG